jgi:hypothetical protein
MSATDVFAGLADAAALAPFIQSYKRVAGASAHSGYRDVQLPGPQSANHGSEAGLGHTTTRFLAEPPSATTTSSFSELRTMSLKHVPPRYAPAERFVDPMTASQEIGWRTTELGGLGYKPDIQKYLKK